MPNKKDNETISSVSDILGFILEQSEKPPDKRRPIEYDGDSTADSEYVGAIVDALAAPGAFVNEQMVGTLEDFLNVEFDVNMQSGRLPSAKVTLNDLPDLIRDPSGTIDKAFAKNRNISKLQRVQWAGKAMKSVVSSAYARKRGLFDDYDPEMKGILERAVGQSALEGMESDITWIVDASQRIKEKGSLANKLDDLERQLQGSLPKWKKDKLEVEKNRILGIYNKAITSDVTRSIGATEVTPEIDAVGGFRELLREEFSARQEQLLNGRAVKDLGEDEYEKYMKMSSASNTVTTWSRFGGINNRKLKSALQDIKGKERSFKLRKEAAKAGRVFDLGKGKKTDYGQYNSADIRRELKGIDAALRDLGKTKTEFSQMRFWTGLGNLEGTYHGLKSTLGPESIEAVLNGKFFDPKNAFFGCPSTKPKFYLGDFSDEKPNKYKLIKFVKAKKDDKRVLINQYNESMVMIHYMNPVTWMRSLVTGEGFAWLADRKIASLAKVWGFDAQAKGVLTQLKDPKFWALYKKFKGASLAEQKQLLADHAILSKVLSGLSKSNSAFAKKFLKTEKLFGSIERWKGAAKFFSAPQRFKEQVVDKTWGEAKKFMREQLFNVLSKMGMFVKDKAAMAMLEAWKVTGGKALSGAISKAIVGAIGLASNAIAPVVGTLITIAVSMVLDKALKVALKVATYMIIGLVIFVFGVTVLVAGGFMNFKKQSQVDSYSREIPGTIYENPYFGGFGTSETDPGGPGDDPGPGGTLPPFVPGDLPPGQTCLFSSGPSLRCSQGPYSYCTDPAYHQPSHYNSPAIDVATGGNFNAPQFCDVGQGNCTVVAVGQETCQGGHPAGGYVIFKAEYQGRIYQFFVLHVSYGVSSGQTLGPGQAVATIVHDPSWQYCSTGLHAHVTVQINGSYFNPRDAFNKDFGCSISNCPVEELCYWLK